MQSIKRDLSFGVALSALVFTCALAWGSPFVGAGSGSKPAYMQDKPQQEQNKAATFTGTVVKDGELYVLRDTSGQVYKLDSPERAKPFEGKAVKVTGQLDTEAKLIHIENIEGAEA
jgi:uncharacterized protein YdeI (BOF family)